MVVWIYENQIAERVLRHKRYLVFSYWNIVSLMILELIRDFYLALS